MKHLFFAFAFLSAGVISAQTEEQQIKSLLHDFFYAIHMADSSMMLATMHPTAQIVSLDERIPGGISEHRDAKLLAQGIQRLTPGNQVEKIWKYEINVDDRLAQAWLPYTFYLNGQISHCGSNNITLGKSTDGWKIIHLVDTRKKSCEYASLEADLQQFMDQWHQAAAVADEDKYFGSMTADGIFLGTDATEKWYTHEIASLFAEHFEKESAWSFKAREREFYFSDDQNTAWFDEVLDTWMGECRGSGVLVRNSDDTWSLAHYNLAILVPNDLVKDYLELRKQLPQEDKPRILDPIRRN